MEENSTRAIVIAVFVFITIAVVSSVLLLFSYGKQLASSTGGVTNISGNVEADDFERFNGTVYDGSYVKSTVYKYQESNDVIIILSDKDGNVINSNVVSTIKNESGVIDQSKLDSLVSSVQKYEASTYSQSNNRVITFRLSTAVTEIQTNVDNDISMSEPKRIGYDKSTQKYKLEIRFDEGKQETNRNYFLKISKPGYIKGDVNQDGLVNGNDIALISMYIAKTRNLTPDEKEIADMDNNKTIDSKDIAGIQKIVTKEIPSTIVQSSTIFSIVQPNTRIDNPTTIDLSLGEYIFEYYYVTSSGIISLKQSKNISITNQAPTISNVTTDNATINNNFDINDGIVYVGTNKSFKLNVNASDIDGDPLTYSWTIKKVGLNTETKYTTQQTGIYTFTDAYYSVVVRAEDTAGLYAEKMFIISASSQSQQVTDQITGTNTKLNVETPIVQNYKVTEVMFYGYLPKHGGYDQWYIEGINNGVAEKIVFDSNFKTANNSYSYKYSLDNTIGYSSNSVNSSKYIIKIPASKTYTQIRCVYQADPAHIGRDCFSGNIFEYNFKFEKIVP